MSTSSSATSTELIIPENFDTKEFFSNKKENFIIIAFTFLIGLFMWTISPGVGIQALSFAMIYAIASLSLNYQVGVTGIINFGAVGFFAIGAYATTLSILLGWNWFSSLIIGILVTVFISYLIGKSLLNLREDYFAIITIVIGEIIRYIFNNENWIVYPLSIKTNYGGSNGLVPQNPIRSNLSTINILNVIQYNLAQGIYTFFNTIHSALTSIGLPDETYISIGIPNWYMFNYNAKIAGVFLLNGIDVQNLIFLTVMIIALIIGYIVFERIYNSPIGRLDKAIREDDLSAESTGVDVFKSRMFVFTFGNILMALAGAFFAFQLGAISPENFLPLLTFYIWAIIVLGGIANNRGVILGAVIFGTSAPLVSNIQLRSQIIEFSGSLVKPFIPSVMGLFTDIIDTKIKTWTNTIKVNLTWFLNLITNPIMNLNVSGSIIPLSTLILAVLTVIVILVKIMYDRRVDASNISTKRVNDKLIINAVVVLVLALFLTNFIVSPSQTFIISVTVSTLFLLSTVVIAVLLLIVQVMISNYRRNKIVPQNSKLLYQSRKVLSIFLLLNLIPAFLQNFPILPYVNFDNYNVAQSVSFVPVSYFFTGLNPDLARIMVVGLILMTFILFKPEGILREKHVKTVDSLAEYMKYYQKHIATEDSDLELPKPGEDSEEVSKKDILTAKGLTKNFGGVVGLDKVSVTVKRGSLLGVIGPNGSGKSTFFNVLTGLLEQDKNQEGRIDFLDKDVTFSSISERARLGMGRTFQQSRLFKNLTVLENVLVSAKDQKGSKLLSVLIGNWKKQESELHQQAFQILQYLNILHIWNNKASDISGGQQKLVALARALMSQSHIILLDEPVAGVNPTLAKKIFEKIQTLHQKEGHHYIIIEHNMDVQLNFCDYVFVFNKGQIVAEGSPDEIRSNESVLDAYLGH